MSDRFESVEDALLILSNPSDPAWGDAFRLLASHPDTAEIMLATFQETLEQLGVSPSGIDPSTGKPAYALSDVARAMGVEPAALEASPPEGLQ